MKLDLLYEIDAPKPWDKPHPYGQREAEQRAYREAIEQIKLGDSLGFNTIWAVEHHFREGRSHCPAPETLLGALSQITEQIRLGFGVTLTPFGFTPPQRIAEKVASVDILSNGRVEWGTGRSTPMEQAAFHVDREQSRADWAEAIKIVVGMWREEYFEYESERFSFPRRMVTPEAGAGPAPAGVDGRHLGELGHRGRAEWARASVLLHHATPGDAGQGHSGIPGGGQERHAVDRRSRRTRSPPTRWSIAPTPWQQAEADGIWESVAWWYQNLAQFTLEWELPHLSKEEQDATFPLMKPLIDGIIPVEHFHEADMLVVGDPERCYQKMKHYADLGVDQLICYVQFGHNSHESVMKTIELLGKEVLPELEGYKANIASS